MELTLVNAGTEHVDPKFKDFLSEVKKKKKKKVAYRQRVV